jgi:hypothetical protein
MMGLSMRKQLLALLVSVPLVASGAAGVVLHVCQSMGGVVVGDCDCEKQAHHGDHAGHGEGASHAAHQADTKLQTQPCCTVEFSNASQLIATQEAFSPRVDEASVALIVPTDGNVVTSRRVCDAVLFRERAPPNIHGPPIFVRHCSFLN